MKKYMIFEEPKSWGLYEYKNKKAKGKKMGSFPFLEAAQFMQDILEGKIKGQKINF